MRHAILRTLSLVALCAASLGAQTIRKTQTRAIVRDSACAPATGWIARDTTYRTMTEATNAAKIKLTCPAPPPPPDTTPTPPPPVSGAAWLESFSGQPAAPAPFTSPNWNVSDYSAHDNTWVMPTPMDAQHSHECAGPPLTHLVDTYEKHVFTCRDHMMTATNEEGYGAIVLTPNRMLLIGDSVTTFRMNINTASQSERDWWRAWLTPWDDALPMPAADWAPGLNGHPRTGIAIENNLAGDCPLQFVNHAEVKLPCLAWQPLSERMTLSFSVRTTVEVQISRTHIKVLFPVEGFVFADTDLSVPLAAGAYVLQLGHYSYNPTKSFVGAMPNTWHWDEVSLSHPVPFTIINGAPRAVTTDDARITFSAPAPANARLQFSASGWEPQVSFNNGATWTTPTRAPFVRLQEYETTYRTAIPMGTTSLLVRFPAPFGSWPRDGKVARDFTIWAR